MASPDPDAALTPEEFAYLKEVAAGLLRHAVFPTRKDRLIQLGLIEEKLGGLTMTVAGTTRPAKGS